MDQWVEDIILNLDRLQADPQGFPPSAIAFIARRAVSQLRVDHPLPTEPPETSCKNQLDIYSLVSV